MKNKTAQELINETDIKNNEIDNLKFFYPEIWKQRETDKNITKILKDLKEIGRASCRERVQISVVAVSLKKKKKKEEEKKKRRRRRRKKRSRTFRDDKTRIKIRAMTQTT